ncbi:MAG: 50S ribosomal protein L29 [Armatimonadetes bacterium]|nr:50S ribosomal protein L29 [Armatimonadota bacterium]
MKRTQKINEWRESSRPELEARLQEVRRNLYMFRQRVATKQLENTKAIYEARKDIARLLTLLREDELKAQGGQK